MQHEAPRAASIETCRGTCSGFIISSDGYIVTNNHIIDKALHIKVTLNDCTKLPAKLIGADPKSDLAAIKIETLKPLASVTWGDS